VNCVSPGIVQRDPISPDQMSRLQNTNYLKSYGQPEDISNMVTFLASEEASFITGQEFIVDGGRSLGLKGD
jgi:3-oxoacyl-[acyl-carrier protein] reductase